MRPARKPVPATWECRCRRTCMGLPGCAPGRCPNREAYSAAVRPPPLWGRRQKAQCSFPARRSPVSGRLRARPCSLPCLQLFVPPGLFLPRLAVYRRPYVFQRMRDARQALRMADKKITARLQVLAQSGNHPLLRLAVEIDHHIAAENDRERMRPGVGFHKVYAAECHLRPQRRRSLVTDRRPSLGGKVAAQPGRGHTVTAFHSVDRALRETQRLIGDVAGCDADPAVGQGFIEHHGQCPNLRACRTCGAPDLDRVSRAQPGDHLIAQELEMDGLAKERSVIGGQGIDHRQQRHAGTVGHDALVVILEAMEAAAAHQFAQSRRHQFLLAGFEVQPKSAACQLADLLELLGTQGSNPVDFSRLRLAGHESFTLETRSRSRMSPTRQSPRIAPPAPPVTFLKVSPRALMTTSCLPISSSTRTQKRCPSTSATTSTPANGSSLFGCTWKIRYSRTTGNNDPRTSAISARCCTVHMVSAVGRNISRMAKSGTM